MSSVDEGEDIIMAPLPRAVRGVFENVFRVFVQHELTDVPRNYHQNVFVAWHVRKILTDIAPTYWRLSNGEVFRGVFRSQKGGFVMHKHNGLLTPDKLIEVQASLDEQYVFLRCALLRHGVSSELKE